VKLDGAAGDVTTRSAWNRVAGMFGGGAEVLFLTTPILATLESWSCCK
jgi:hypothetical protein